MAATAAPPSLLLLPYGEDALLRLAQQLTEAHAEQLPDLSSLTVLLPEPQGAPQLRGHLLDLATRAGHGALLGPNIMTLGEWLAAFPLPHPVMSPHGRELLLVEALREHQGLFGAGSLWTLADALLELFDELTLNQVGLPESLAQFRQRIARGYGAAELDHPGLEMETRLVYTLWHAWHSQLRESGHIDSATATVLRLRASLAGAGHAPLYLLAPAGHSRAEREWLRALLAQGHVRLVMQGELAEGDPAEGYLPDGWLREVMQDLGCSAPTQPATTPLSALLHQVYDSHPLPMQARAAAFAAAHGHSPLRARFEIFAADSAEQEARGVETQVRLWLLEGKRHIGIVTEDRRLARRVRALLERAGILIHDSAGWALSTTSAAAAVERWLQCVEEDFPWRPLLDLLKSPFFACAAGREAHLETVYRLERQIIHNDGIGSGLARYRARIIERQQLLAQQGGGDFAPLLALLERLEQAARWLAPCLSGESMAAERIGDLLQASLREVGVWEALASDAAGVRLLDELQQMRAAAAGGRHRMSWEEFRGWLGRTLERFNFRPSTSAHAVRLMSLAQSTQQRFDGLILAGADQQHLPGNGGSSPFFNDQVRRELGLVTRERQLGQRFHLFRGLLEAAPHLLVTHRREENGEELALSPWLELLTAFHRLAWHGVPEAATLRALLDDPASEIARRDAPLPGVEGMPAPSLPLPLIPQRISASGYQQLLDCPYRFFAARGLQLSPPETIREALEKVDYGEKVHRCLQAFHDGVVGLPGPFARPLTATCRDEALGLMQAIAEAEFLHGLGQRFENRAWLKRWQELIPLYIDWQIAREGEWHVARHEESRQRDDLISTLTLHGRLDRIDQGVEGVAVVDYKTGQVARPEEVLQGEAVQLPFYALLVDGDTTPVVQVEFLRLDEGKVTSPVVLSGDELLGLKRAIGERLATLVSQLREGQSLPAWGDERACSRCDMEGVCRRPTWPL